jgi:hypothetical protein
MPCLAFGMARHGMARLGKASASLLPRFAKPLARKLSVHLRSLEPDEIWLGEDCVLNREKFFF